VRPAQDAVAEAKELRGRLARAERAVHAYGADDRLDRLELKAKVGQLEETLLRAMRQNVELERRLERWREKRSAR
jgi:hypothetical protein